MSFLSSHLNLTTLGWVIGVWAAIATFITATNKWPKPAAPKWKVVLHVILVDWPAGLPSLAMQAQTIFGVRLPFAIPFLTISRDATGNVNITKGDNITKILLLAFFAGMVLSACATSRIDKTRQTLQGIEMSTNGVVQSMAVYDMPHQESLLDQAVDECKSDQNPVECSKNLGRQKVDMYRSKRSVVLHAVASLEATLFTAEAAVLVAEGSPDSFDPTPILQPVMALVAALQPLLVDIGLVKNPGGGK